MQLFTAIKNKKVWLAAGVAVFAVIIFALPRSSEQLSADFGRSSGYFNVHPYPNIPYPTPINQGIGANSGGYHGQNPGYGSGGYGHTPPPPMNYPYPTPATNYYPYPTPTTPINYYPYPTPTPTPINNYPYGNNTNPMGNTGTTGNGSFSLTSNNNFCVGQIPVYTITASSAWANQNINWASLHNGFTTNESYTLNSSGSWSASGNMWDVGDVGSWQKTATINGTAQTLTFSVQNCQGDSINGNPSSSINSQNPGGSTGTSPSGTGSSGISTGSSGSGSFSLTSNNNFCVGQQPVYTITSSSAWANQTINWTSSHNGVTTNESYTLNSTGSWSAYGNMWDVGDVGSWQKTATINGTTQTLTFSVQNCQGDSINGGNGS